MIHRLLAALVAFACAGPSDALVVGPQAGVSSIHLSAPVIEIPMDLSTEHISVQVEIGDAGRFDFNLDTYAVTTACVDEGFARRMGFEKVDTVWNGDGSGKRMRRDVVLIPELQFGGATFRNVRALVDDYSWVPTPDGGSIDGLLGYHLFRGLLLELDYPRERVVLREGELEAGARHVISSRRLRRQPDVPLVLGGRRRMVGIDSGASSALSLPLAYKDELELLAPARLVGRASTVYSEADILSGVLAGSVEIAGHVRRGDSATFSELFGRPLIGHRLLRDYSVTFDQKNGRVRFAKPVPDDAAAVDGED